MQKTVKARKLALLIFFYSFYMDGQWTQGWFYARVLVQAPSYPVM